MFDIQNNKDSEMTSNFNKTHLNKDNSSNNDQGISVKIRAISNDPSLKNS